MCNESDVRKLTYWGYVLVEPPKKVTDSDVTNSSNDLQWAFVAAGFTDVFDANCIMQDRMQIARDISLAQLCVFCIDVRNHIRKRILTYFAQNGVYPPPLDSTASYDKCFEIYQYYMGYPNAKRYALKDLIPIVIPINIYPESKRTRISVTLHEDELRRIDEYIEQCKQNPRAKYKTRSALLVGCALEYIHNNL